MSTNIVQILQSEEAQYFTLEYCLGKFSIKWKVTVKKHYRWYQPKLRENCLREYV